MLRPLHSDDNTSAPADLVTWFVRRTGAGWRASDEAELFRWLEADPKNRQAWLQWASDWALMDQLPADVTQRLRAQVQADRAAAGRSPVASAATQKRRRSFAASLTLASVTAMAVGWTVWQQLPTAPAYQQAFNTQAGQLAQFTLPDGSQVQLDTSTTIKIEFHADRREVRLNRGQAFFAVQHDAARPFNVRADDVRVTVVGTQFNVRLTPDVSGREAVEISVEEGKVHVAVPDLPDQHIPPILLSAGQMVTVHARSHLVAKPSPANAGPPWRNGQLSFSDVPLRQAVSELRRYAALDVESLDPAVASLRLTGTFNPHDGQATRQLLATALPIRFEQGAHGWHVKPKR